MRVHPWAIGLFLILGIGFFTAILFLIGSRYDIFGRHVVYYAEFSDIAGLPVGAQVRVSGLEAGAVKRIEPPRGPDSKFRLTLQLEAKVRGMIRTDSVASIETEGIVGDKYLSIHSGTSGAPEAPSGATLYGKPPFDLGVVMDKGTTLLNDFDVSVNDLHHRLDIALDSATKTVNHVDGLIVAVQPDIKHMASNASQIAGTVNSIVSDLNAGKGPAGLFLRDEATRQQLQAVVSNAQQASLNLNHASAQADRIMVDIQSRNLPAKAQVTLSNLSDVSQRADRIVADLQDRDLAAKVQATLDNVQAMSQELKEAINGALASDNLGQDGASNIRETLSNLNRGTANLAEDTEALKHEFFFRGFFKKRGFYDLDELAPADYLKACEREKVCGTRAWLQAANLFGAGSDGKEQLVETGRHQIDSAVAPFVDTLLNHVVIVEGYAVGGPPDQQYVTSRRRADLVREYLEAHFHLIHSDVGIVPLGDKPPQGAERAAWNGVAIVRLEER
jgi:phospholipid/cholesterol/gamma-HCH transport system substrate-binding protein